jgi:uncharacterized FlaG/YvyC family protein
VDIGGITSTIAEVGVTVTSAHSPLRRKPAPVLRETQQFDRKAEALKAVEEIIRATETRNVVEIQYDKEMNKVIIQVLDGQTGQTVKQIPSEDLVEFMKRFRQYLSVMTDRRI